jgi:hypothetical protein
VLLDSSKACRATLLLLLLLLQVVVDSHESAKALLDRGQLTKRVTIIPLNQVRQPTICAICCSQAITTLYTPNQMCRAVLIIYKAILYTHLDMLCGASCAQVRYQEAHPSVLSAAAKLGGGKAQPALQLIGYEQEVEAAIKYAFGTTFVCQVSCWL